MKCRIYYNLHRKCWSVQEKIPSRGWIVVDHASEVFLEEMTFQVSEAGRQRVIRTKRKNVHAFGIGNRIPMPLAYDTIKQYTWCWELASYNPYKFGTFYRTLGDLHVPIERAKFAHFTSDRKLRVLVY